MKILLFLYNIAVLLLTPLGFVLGLIYVFLKKDTKHYGERFGFIKLPALKGETIWLHAASVGEVRSVENLIESLRERFSGVNIIVTTMTTNGLKIAKNNTNIDYVFLLPIENIPAFKYIILTLNVKAILIVDTEIWPNFIYTASIYSKIILINARISDKTFKTYSQFKYLFKPFLAVFSAILTKSDVDFKRFKSILGDDKTVVNLGDIKFQKRKNISDIKPMYNDVKYALAASTHSGEEELIIKAFEEAQDKFDKLIIAPRHIARAEEIRAISSNPKIEVIDEFGLLESLYINADKIFIGGSIANIGGHNIYEALQFKKKVAVGKNMYNFAEIYAISKDYNLTTELSTHSEILAWLKSESCKGDFDSFFKTIDEKNNNIIEKIGDIIASILHS